MRIQALDILRFAILFQAANFACPPALAAPQCEVRKHGQWQPAQLPAALEEKMPGGKVTILKAVINTRGEMGYLIRADSGGGMHAAPARIFVRTKHGWNTVFHGDVGIGVPLIVLPRKTRGFFDLCDPSPCCGYKPPLFRFNGSVYELANAAQFRVK